MTLVRDYFRRRRVQKHVRANGWVFEYEGISFRVPEGTDTAVANALLRGKYEAEEIRMIKAYLPADRPVIELGGSLGVVSSIISANVKPGTAHLVVEANPELNSICLENARASGNAEGVSVIEAAISYSGEKVSFWLADNPHSSGLDLAPKSNGRQVEVDATTLAKLHSSIGDPPEYSLICDIEGGEVAMIARDAQAVSQAGILIIELHPEVDPDGARQIPGQLADMGFELIEQVGNVYAWRKSHA